MSTPPPAKPVSDPVVLTEKTIVEISGEQTGFDETEIAGALSIEVVMVTTFEGEPPERQKTEFIPAYAILRTSVVLLTNTGVTETSKAAAVALSISCQPAATFVLVCHW